MSKEKKEGENGSVDTSNVDVKKEASSEAKNEDSLKTKMSRGITWQKKEDRDDRIQMIHLIVRLLRTKKPNAPPTWLKKLPDMARRLEDTLYRLAKSKEEYMNRTTLKARLQDVARQMGARVRKKQAQEPSKTTTSTTEPPTKRAKMEVNKTEVKAENKDSTQDGGEPQKRMIVDLGAINSAAVAPASRTNANTTSAPSNGTASSSTRISKAEEELEKRKRRAHLLRQQQQRLLLLRHASKCQAKPCKQTKLCPQMKWLWKHIAKCKDKRCQVAHCVSSRYVLTHYHQCGDKKCQVCAPVRAAIHNQQKRRRQIEEARRKPKKRKLTKEEKEKRRKRMANVIHSLTKDELSALFGSLRTEFNPFWNTQRMKMTFKPLLKKITDLEWGWIFAEPVDPDKLQLKDYWKIITRPMDLGTVKRNLDKGLYKVPKHMYHDVKLTFDNAMTFNPEGSDVHAIAKEYMEKFKDGFSEVMTQMIEQEKIARSRKDACTMCGGERFTFEPQVFYCNGRCHKRIRRNAFYYTTKENKYHYCQSCYQTCLKPQFELNGETVNKRDLLKKKNNEVQCDTCKGWLHMICCLFNHRNNESSDETKYECPHCVLKKLKDKGDEGPLNKDNIYQDAKALPQTKFGKFLEDRMNKFIEKAEIEMQMSIEQPTGATAKRARSQNAEDKEKVAQAMESIPPITLRILSIQDKSCYAKDNILKWFNREYGDNEEEKEEEEKKKPVKKEKKTTRSETKKKSPKKEKEDNDNEKKEGDEKKDGEEGDEEEENEKEEEEPQKKSVYPKQFPHKAKAMLMFQKQNGIDICIFGMYVQEYGEDCPEPNRRKVYISYLDSVKYFTPSRLRTKLYHELLIGYLQYTRQRGFTHAYIWSCPPNPRDDYIMYCHPPSQKTPRADRLRQWYIDMIEKARLEGLVVDRSNLTDYHFSVDKNLLTLPNFDGDYWPGEAEGVLEEIMKEQDLEDKDRRGNRGKTKKPKTPQKKKKKKDEEESEEQSEALKRLRERMEKAASKEDFIVVQMHYRCAKCDEYQLNGTFWYDTICKENHETERSYALCETCYDKEKSKLTKRQREEVDRVLSEEEEERKRKEAEKGSDSDDMEMIVAPSTPPRQSSNSMMPKSKKNAKTSITASTTATLSMSQRMLRLRKAEVKCAESTKDPDPNKDSEFFGTRQAFLSLCQGNHYQFDQLRRAKHSTMMVLYHLHNPQQAGFVHSCNKCGNNIVEGRRFHCEICPDYDLCYNCAHKYNGRCNLNHPLKGINVDGSGSYIDEETRKKRERMIRLHMSLLVHASSCRKKKCPSQNCAKMKALLKHGKTCKKRNQGCHVCRRIWTLLQIHARQCRTEKCKVLQCASLKNYFRKIQLAADDRRRQAYSAYQQQSRVTTNSTSSSSSSSQGRGRPRGSRSGARKPKKGKGSKGTKKGR